MAKNTEFLDTNCLLRYVLGDNQEQAAKVEQLVMRGVRVETAAFLEFVWVLESFYKMNRPQVWQKNRSFYARQKSNLRRHNAARSESALPATSANIFS